MQLIRSKFNEGICFLLCAIDISSEYIWVISLKDKKSIIIANGLKKYEINLIVNQRKYG